MKCYTTLTVTAVLSLAAAPAMADPISWSYASEGFSDFRRLGNPERIHSVLSDSGIEPSGQLRFSDVVSEGMGPGLSEIVLVTWRADHNDARYPGDTSTFADTPYTVELRLRDGNAGAEGVFTFEGSLRGEFNDSFADLTNTFLGPDTQSLPIGDNLYTVTVGPFANDSPHSPTGFIGARVEVHSLHETPEPSALTLLGLGLSGFGLAGWKRGQRRRIPATA